MTISEVNLREIINLIPNQVHVKIHGCFRLTVIQGWKQSLQNNQDQHILFVKSGLGKYCFKDKEEILKKGKIVYVSSNCPHNAWHDVENPLVITGLRFGLYDNVSDKLIQLPCNPFHISMEIEDIEFYDKLCSNINNNYYFIDKHSSQLICSSLITHLLVDILKYHEPFRRTMSVQDSRIERVQRFMMDDLTSKVSIEELAARVNMSSRHLQSCFKQKYGVTPKQYQLRIRLNHAKFLLQSSDLSIKKIANSLGYSDQFVFSRQFKNEYGFAPSELRGKHLCENLLLFTPPETFKINCVPISNP